jgi:hypothetical protein
VFGEGDGYNSHARQDDIEEIANGRVFGRFSVNPVGVINYLSRDESDRTDSRLDPSAREKATIEFRAMRYTTNPELMKARVALARAIVDYVKDNKPTYWLLRSESLAEILEELEIYKH